MQENKKKIFEKIYCLNRGWWDSFTSCFLGTILGIGITFGISGYLDKKSNAELQHTIQLMNVMYMDETVYGILDDEDEALYRDSVFTEILSYYPDSTNFVPKELVNEFYTILLNLKIEGEDESIENIYKNSIEVWKSAENLSNVTNISKFYASKNTCENGLSHMSSILKSLYDNLVKKKFLYGTVNYDEITSAIYENEENLTLIKRYCLYRTALSATIPMMEDIFESIKIRMGITDKDLESINDDICDLYDTIVSVK